MKSLSLSPFGRPTGHNPEKGLYLFLESHFLRHVHLTERKNSSSLILANKIKSRASELGFDACGIAEAGQSDTNDHFLRWLSNGFHADMQWLEKNFQGPRT